MITQGINKEYIFEDELYKNEYLNLLKKTVNAFNNTLILAYCIMDNHTHLLFYTEDMKELSKIMSKVNTSYGIFYNNINNRVGYVFRNRYYMQDILDKKHLFNTLAYIHKNPVKANIVNDVSEYKYSSYNSYENHKIKEENINVVFGIEDYMEQFHYIHENFSEENILEIDDRQDDEEEKAAKVIGDFCEKYDLKIDYLKKDNYLLKMLIQEIKDNCNITNKMICKIIGIGKNRITNLSRK